MVPKDACQQQVVRQDVEGQVDGSIDGPHLLGALGEGTGQYEDPDHHQDVLVAGSERELVDALLQLQAAGDGYGIARREQEGHGDGHFVEVVHQQRRHEVEAEEHGERAECPPASLPGLGGFLHK